MDDEADTRATVRSGEQRREPTMTETGAVKERLDANGGDDHK
ncbi:hypothetical protein CBM2585_A10069 [Cupriavidus taiwanensis]|nr:hypothetical protein CBM2585_A10069 [Cupriavidus taiwanensis]